MQIIDRRQIKSKYVRNPYNFECKEIDLSDFINNKDKCIVVNASINTLRNGKLNGLNNVDVIDCTTADIVYEIIQGINKKSKENKDEIYVFIINVSKYSLDKFLFFINKYSTIFPKNSRIIFCIDKMSLFEIDYSKLKGITIFDMECKRNDIVKWAISSNIHPILCAFISNLVYSSKIDILTKNKIMLASQVLEETNNIYLLKPIIGDELFEILKKNCMNINTLSLDDILNRNYNTDIAIPLRTYYEIAYLSQVDEKNVEVVRNYIIERNGHNSLLEYFDLLWSRNNENRKAILDELNKTNNMLLRKK
ncbi:MAG: hypothetical protein ACI33S_00655 [Bacilli bacterium]